MEKDTQIKISNVLSWINFIILFFITAGLSNKTPLFQVDKSILYILTLIFSITLIMLTIWEYKIIKKNLPGRIIGLIVLTFLIIVSIIEILGHH